MKILDGSAAHDPQRINHFEPAPLPGDPDCPEILDTVGMAKWRELVALHRERGTLSREMAGPIATYCAVFSRKEKLREILENEGMFIKGSYGSTIAHPALRTLEKAEAMLLRLDVEFGFTPSSRTKCVTNAPPKDDLESFLEEAKA